MGVARQWCGRLGKVENCQVGVCMGYVTRMEHALVNVRFYLPESWAKDMASPGSWGAQDDQVSDSPSTGVGDAGGVRGELPHIWIAGDDEMGRPSGFRLDLRAWANGICWLSPRIR